MFQHSFRAIGLGLLLCLIAVDAAPADTEISPRNVLGTSLVGFNGCDKYDWWKSFIQEAYKEAHQIVNVDGVKANIVWNSEAAIDFFGPPDFNKDQRGQIQAVLANVETMQPAFFLNPFGHSLQVRCDDPIQNCRLPAAYAVNPNGSEYPYINFCEKFFRTSTLDYVLDHFGNDPNEEWRLNIEYYMNRGLVFLHELFHIDLAADSERGEPNPKIYDIKMSYYDSSGEIARPTTAYRTALSKILAKFVPREKDKDPKFAGYWERARDPQRPDPRQGKSSFIAYEAGSDSGTKLYIDPSDLDEEMYEQVEVDDTHTTDEVFEVGEPYSLDDYPESYRKAYEGWLEKLANNSSGTCKLDIEEIWTCEDVAKNLYARAKITDPSGNILYQTPGSVHSPGVPINDAHPLEIKEDGMSDTSVIVGEHAGDYIRFTYGSSYWSSSDTEGDASCKLVGDNWNENGPGDCDGGAEVRTFACQYPC